MTGFGAPFIKTEDRAYCPVCKNILPDGTVIIETEIFFQGLWRPILCHPDCALLLYGERGEGNIDVMREVTVTLELDSALAENVRRFRLTDPQTGKPFRH